MCVCVCFRGAREQKEVSDYLPPPLPLMLSAGFISPLHFQIKFVLRMGEQWGMFVCVGVVCVCVCVGGKCQAACFAPSEQWGPRRVKLATDDDVPDVIRLGWGLTDALCVCGCVGGWVRWW